MNESVNTAHRRAQRQKGQNNVSGDKQPVVKVGTVLVIQVSFWQNDQHQCQKDRNAHGDLPDVMTSFNGHPTQH